MNSYTDLLKSEDTLNNENEYPDILLYVQEAIVKRHIKDLSSYLQNKNHQTESILKKHITSCLDEKHWNNEIYCDRIFIDMTSYGFLNKYFADMENIEEINVNAWNGAIIVNYCNGKQEYLDEHFISPEHAVSVLQRMVAQSNNVLDDKSPSIVTFLGKSIRLAASIAPLVDKEIAVMASIRFTHPKKLDKNTLLTNETLSPEMMTALEVFINHGVSMVYAGATGSGKTSLMNTVLSSITKKRTITLEDGMRDFELIKKDENGKVINDVVHLQTRQHRNADYKIDLQDLLDYILRCNAKVVCVGEMVSEEAYIAQEISRAGTALISSMHTLSADTAYNRMYTLGLRKYANVSKQELIGLYIEAFPIVVFMKEQSDGSRKVTQIIEAYDYDAANDKLIYSTLFQFIKTDNIKNDLGEIVKIEGYFEKVNDISEKLRNRLINMDMSKDEVTAFMRGEFYVKT